MLSQNNNYAGVLSSSVEIRKLIYIVVSIRRYFTHKINTLRSSNSKLSYNLKSMSSFILYVYSTSAQVIFLLSVLHTTSNIEYYGDQA